MPGFYGLVSSWPTDDNRQSFKTIIENVSFESTYSRAEYVDEESGIFVGSTSHRGAMDDCMPILSERRDVALVLSGEIFIDVERIEELSKNGHIFRRNSLEYLVHLYEEKGDSFFELLNGCYCGIVINKRKAHAQLFNDRYGMKRLYYSTRDGLLAFSTEAKALLRVSGETASFDSQGLLEYFSFGCPLQGRTLFEGISLLPGGSCWSIKDKRLAGKRTFFDISTWENQETLPISQFYPRLRETFRNILPKYLAPSSSIGISLTGGLDTRMIMANAVLSPGQVPCYSFSGMYRDCYDAKIARRIANVCGQSHSTIRLGRDFLTRFPTYAEKTISLSEGAIDLNAAPDLYVNTIVKDIRPIRLTGNYGSEVLRGVRWLQSEREPHILANRDLYAGAEQANEVMKELNSKHPLTFTLLYDGPWHEYGRFAVENSQLVQRTPYLDNDLVSLMYQAPAEANSNKTLSIRLIADGNSELACFPTDRGFPLDKRTPRRVIYQNFAEALFKAEYMFNYGAPSWLVSMEYLIPFFRFEKLFLGRHKFYHYRSWFRDELSGYIKEILLDRCALSRSFFNSKNIENVVKLHTAGKRNFTREIHVALNLELTSRLILKK